MSLMFLNPFDNSGLGLYSKTAKSIVERMPVLAKQRRHSVKSRTTSFTEEDENYTAQFLDNPINSSKSLLPIKKRNIKSTEPFTKSLSREQRAFAQSGKNKYPAVGAYHPKEITKHPKFVWNVLGAYQQTIKNKREILERRQKIVPLSKSRNPSKKKEEQNPENQDEAIKEEVSQEEMWREMVSVQDINYEKFRYRNQLPFVDMSRMMGRESTSKEEQYCFDTVESEESNTFLTSEVKNVSPSKGGTLEFSKQLSRQKVSSLFKQNSNLVYDCNYNLVSHNNKMGPRFSKMVNREGKSIHTEMSNQEFPNYSEIWMNRNKKSLPNLEVIMQRKLKKERLNRIKTEAQS